MKSRYQSACALATAVLQLNSLSAQTTEANTVSPASDLKTDTSTETLNSSSDSNDVTNESPRERGRVLLKRNPIASEYQTFGNLGSSRGAYFDGEGVDFRGYFKSSDVLDSSDQRKASMDVYFSDQSSTFKPGGSISIREIFGKDSDWAIEVSARTSASDRIFEHYQSNWTELLELDEDGNRILDENEQAIAQTNLNGDEVYFLDRLRTSRDLIYTRSHAYKFRAEHAWNESHRTYFEASLSDYFSNNNRNRSEMNFRQNSAVPGFGDGPIGDATSITEGDYTNAWIRRYHGDTDTDRFTQRYVIGGKVDEDSWSIDYSLYASEFENKVLWYDWNFFDFGLAGSYSVEDRYLPSFELTRDGSAFDVRDISQANFSSLRIHDTTTTDTDYAARIDFDSEIDFGSSESFLSTGILYREKERNNDHNRQVFGANPDDVFTLEDVQKDFDPGYIVEATYPLSRGLAPTDGRNFVVENPDLFVFNERSSFLETARQLYDAYESVSGFYVHSSLGFGRLRIDAGARAEYTETETTGTNVGEDDMPFETTQTNNYWNFLPTIEATYRTSPELQFTASWYEILMRPQYFDIVPYERISFPTRNISRGNPDLEPTVIDSFQVAVEYDSSWGDFGFEIYYKKISDFFYDASSTQQFLGETFNTRTIGNGDEGDIYGLQFQYEKDLDFLEPVFDGGSFSFAYTLSESEATVPTRPGEEILVPGRSRHNLLTSLSLEKGPISGGISVAFQSYSLDDVGGSRGEDRYREETFSLDANAKYKLNDDISFSAKLFNLTDHPERAYLGDPVRVTNNQFGSWAARLSVDATF
ncbi:MAG: TonB-dependent receptor domain-containing protein [Opitutales bacterium]